MENEFKNAFDYKVIYVFAIDDEKHKGKVKIGDATLHTTKDIEHLSPNSRELNQAALERIKAYTNTAGITPKLLHTELAVRTVNDGGKPQIKAFRDYDVHAVLKKSGIKNSTIDETTGKEWFDIDLQTAEKAISAVKHNAANLSNSDIVAQTPIIFRPEQEDAIRRTVKQFKKDDRMLWNAKMRFGKTICALEVVRQMKFHKTIILTHRPVVNEGWYEDFTKIFRGNPDYIYGSKANGYTIDSLLKSGKNFVYFASVQDLRGSSQVGGKFNKNDVVFSTVWDCVIVDEAHEGTTTLLGEDTVKAVLKEDKGTKLLALSGTPFNILDGYEEDSIYTWDYMMEQECKSEWDKNHFGDSNPYEELPELRIYTYDLGQLTHNKYIAYEDKAFNFHEFFRTWTGDYEVDHANMPTNAKIGDFVHEDDVLSFLNMLTNPNQKSMYPYSTEEYRKVFKHTLWIVPGVKEARALKKLMMDRSLFGNGMFEIVNVAGNGDEDEKSEEALSKVKTAIKNAGEDNYTITLSCGKLTTGVTIREWTGVFMLAGSYSTSAANYLQTIFRVQSPCNINGKIKETSYVFDFAPDRTLKMVSEAVSISSKAGKHNSDDKKVLGKFLNYCPVIAISGSEMKEYSANKLLQQLKRAYADKVVRNGFDDSNLYSDDLFMLDEVDIKKFDELKGIIGTSKAAPKSNDITLNEQGLTKEEYEEIEKSKKKPKKDLTDEEKARLEELKALKKLRNDAISILRGISIRMPLLIYGADIPYEEEISLDKFVDMVDDSSWDEFMPAGVTKDKFREFQKYYDEDVFVAAGRRIRNVAKEADTLNPTERVKKIAGLFKYFKNPDKETVLTPWRVVNMHMSDCIGGWDFYEENHPDDGTLDEPRFVDQGKVTHDIFFKPDTRILEINSKTGLYPLYVTYSVFRAKCLAVDKKELTLEKQRDIWFETVRDNIYVICKTPMAKTITRRTLVGYYAQKINAHYFVDLINTMENKPQLFIDKVTKEGYWKKGNGQMKFNAVVGNPPYQEEGDSTRKTPIYHYFYNSSFEIAPIVSLITPARFLFDAGQTPKAWNEKMLSDEHFKVVQYFSDSRAVFPSVDIKGGVAITIRNTGYNYGAIKMFTPYVELNKIITAVESRNKDNMWLDSIIASQGLFRFSETFFDEHDGAREYMGDGTGNKIVSSVIEKLDDVFVNEKQKDVPYIKMLGRVNGKRDYRYIQRRYIVENDYIDKYKLFIPEANNSGKFGEILTEPIVGIPGEGATDTFLSGGQFDTIEEAYHFLKYFKTKFFRCLLGVKKATQHCPPGVWRMIPVQDFTDHSDIDWTGEVKDVDEQLYKKYELTDDEIAFIEGMVRPMG